MTLYRLSDQAEEQIAAIGARSESRYGEIQAHNYEDLILAAIADVAADPQRTGARRLPRSAGIRE